MPLVEIVTEPDFHSASEVSLWLKQLILTLSYIKALDKESGIKADVNVSLYGDRIEIKNVNSISSIAESIIHEEKRQRKEKPVKRETRAWLADKKQTIKMREKESAEDYRFIPEPDLPVIKIKEPEKVLPAKKEAVASQESEITETKKTNLTQKLNPYLTYDIKKVLITVIISIVLIVTIALISKYTNWLELLSEKISAIINL